MKPSCVAVLDLLRSAPEGITPRDALDIGCMRLAARVADLRAEGYEINAELVMVRTRSGLTRVARYTLHEGPRQLRLAV